MASFTTHHRAFRDWSPPGGLAGARRRTAGLCPVSWGQSPPGGMKHRRNAVRSRTACRFSEVRRAEREGRDDLVEHPDQVLRRSFNSFGSFSVTSPSVPFWEVVRGCHASSSEGLTRLGFVGCLWPSFPEEFAELGCVDAVVKRYALHLC